MVDWVPNGTQEHMVDALALEGDEGRGVAAISFGEVCSNRRSEDFRMGKPPWFEDHGLRAAESEPWEVKHLSTRRRREQLLFPK